MGSMIHLAVGKLDIDWGKNTEYADHSVLFQQSDLAKVPYYYVDDKLSGEDEESWGIKVEFKEGLAKPLNKVVDRLNLLGHTLLYSEKEYEYLTKLCYLNYNACAFNEFSKILEGVDIAAVLANSTSRVHDFGDLIKDHITNKSPNPYYLSGLSEDRNLSAYTVLQLLGVNSKNADLPVEWSFSDLVENGWAARDHFVKRLDQSCRFLIVTEGSSDAKILKHAFNILKPHLVDFFDFIDMEDGYPFTGTGNLLNFVKGLISISIQNNVIVLLDNDAEGVSVFNRCSRLSIPSNMRVVKLPDMPEFNDFRTLGPGGYHKANINGRGAAIECYLDLDDAACLRWNNYNSFLDIYQGELMAKDSYKKTFLSQKEISEAYSYTKIEAVLDLIISNCIEIKETELLKELKKELAYLPDVELD